MAIYHVKDANEGSRSIYSTGIEDKAIAEAKRLAKQTPNRFYVVVKLEQIYSTYSDKPFVEENQN
jgi:hypothetical protein